MDNFLHIENLGKHYGDEKWVLEHINATIESGSITGLVGANGSGKTTLMRILSTAAFPSEGSIFFNDLNIHEHPYTYLREVGIVHDTASLPHYVNAVELMTYALRAKEKWTENALENIHALLDMLLLDERRENMISTYSSGMLKKTQIGLALISNPSVLLMDEPLRGLDVESKSATLALLQQRKKEGCLIVIASHMHDALETICDTIIRLD